jgi:uncharacterized membrane-anchored protein
MESAGVNINPEMLAGFSTPVVLFVSWKLIQRIHRSLKEL